MGLQQKIKQKISLALNKNQLREVERLVFEISRRNNTSFAKILKFLEKNPKIRDLSSADKFSFLKNALIEQRFPLASQRRKINIKEAFLPETAKPLKNNCPVSSEFKPLKIIVEKEVKNSFLTDNFKRKFPNTEVEEIEYYSQYLKQNRFDISQLKKPVVFLIKEKGDFIKRCPCTKSHLNCGYWVLNLGFGCPFDCSYCFLQQYTNFPGIILPANIEDFFESFDVFHKKLQRPIRIGTGEFCDSLALDDITGYSKKLISYFKDKNVLFELKTKSAKINNLLDIKAPPNIIISWSLGPAELIKTEEKAVAALEKRLKAARKVQKHGYKLSFHFDPIIHVKGWEKLYSKTIKKLYSYVKGPFAWISLGTLRSNRELKKICEMRFPKSNIFYTELLLGKDRKLRYPEFIKKEIYNKLTEEIRRYDNKTPLYLCMEDKETWAGVKGLVPNNMIESSLLNRGQRFT